MTFPSFAIRGAAFTADPGPVRWAPDLMLRLLPIARRVYLLHLERQGSPPDALGVVVNAVTAQGRLIFESAVLLPDEHFLPLDLVRLRPPGRSGSRQRR
ncbi:MAG: hypothetical protein ACOYMY_02165 [Prochlorococcaceae cyanobacterium]